MNKGSEELTTRVMDGLRNAEAPEGMDQRIVKALQERAASQPATHGFRFALPSKWFAATGATLAACLTLSIFMRHRTEQLPAIAPTSSSSEVDVERSATRQPFKPLLQQSRQIKPPKAPSTAIPNIAAQRETLSSSYPAPPMPLTEQEKLLLRLAHKGDPMQLAMLDPSQRAAQNAADKADFQQFFHPATPPTSSGETK